MFVIGCFLLWATLLLPLLDTDWVDGLLQRIGICAICAGVCVFILALVCDWYLWTHIRHKRYYMGRSIRRITKTMVGGLVLTGVVWGLATYGQSLWEEIQEKVLETQSVLPPNYYENAKAYVAQNYEIPVEKDIGGLVSFLDQIEFREYQEDVFDCSETSSMLEWLLEGAGFSASLATNSSLESVSFMPHTWVLVTLDTGDVVAVEATYLTQNNYAPPGIIESPDGRFREHSYKYRMFLEWKKEYPPSLYSYDPNITFEEWQKEYLIEFNLFFSVSYYSPAEVYESPEVPIRGRTVGTIHYYIPKSEFDWWNAPPYNSMEPFVEWD